MKAWPTGEMALRMGRIATPVRSRVEWEEERIAVMSWICRIVGAVLLISHWGTSAAGAADYVWWEGESAVRTNFPRRSWFSASTFAEKADLLSGGEWLSNSGNRTGAAAFAQYEIEVPADGEYQFWVRKFYKHGPFRWRFDRMAWEVCGRDVALADSTPLRTHVVANWVSLGKVKLEKGRHTFELELLAQEGEVLTAAFDCFLLTRGFFVPNGKLKPDERSGRADEGFFAFEPPVDHFGDDALVDLRYLNEKSAGQSGFVQRKGESFVLGDGRLVRFWGVNVGPNNVNQDAASHEYLARKLAKLGVNMVRIHGSPFDINAPSTEADDRYIENLFHLVSALKREGIYTKLSFYFPLWHEVKPESGIGGYESINNKRPFAMLYFDPHVQQVYRAWARRLLDTKNPHTGLTLAQDSAVAIVEIINEDSFFFYTFAKKSVPEVHWQRLEQRFGQWLIAQHGSLEKAFGGWGNARLPADDAAGRVAGLYEAWHMTSAGLRQGGAAKTRRVGEQVRFLAEQQRAFYESMTQYFKEELRLGGLVSPSNWHVSDAALLDAIERYTYTAGDVIDRHGYFSGKHEGEGANYSVRVGHRFEDAAAVLAPERLPIQVDQVDGYPQIISELGWPNPNRFRADCTFIASAYGALQGIDGVFFFAVGSNYLRDSSMSKFAVSSPVISGAFPATALQYRRGDLREAETAVHEVLRLDELYAMKGSGASTAEALDELRRRDIPPGAVARGRVSRFDPLAYYVGRVVREFEGDPAESFQKNLSRYIDREKGTIRSLTGEVSWDYRSGVIRTNSPRAQGAAGFLSRGRRIELDDVAIESGNEYGSVMVISLDDEPLASARRILIQVVTEERPYGFRAAGGTITDVGGGPLGVRKIDATVSLRLEGDAKPRVVALDENGYAAREVVAGVHGEDGRLVIRLAEDAIYHVIQR